MPTEMLVNVDAKTLEMCLKSIHGFGVTTYQNICTGAITSVPWGTLDWIITLGLLGISGAILLLIGMFVAMAMSEF